MKGNDEKEEENQKESSISQEKEAEEKRNNFVYSWGFGKYGQTGVQGVNYSLTHQKLNICKSEIFQVTGGEFHSFILDIDNNIYAFGKNTFGQLGLEHDKLVIDPIFHNLASKL